MAEKNEGFVDAILNVLSLGLMDAACCAVRKPDASFQVDTHKVREEEVPVIKAKTGETIISSPREKPVQAFMPQPAPFQREKSWREEEAAASGATPEVAARFGLRKSSSGGEELKASSQEPERPTLEPDLETASPRVLPARVKSFEGARAESRAPPPPPPRGAGKSSSTAVAAAGSADGIPKDPPPAPMFPPPPKRRGPGEENASPAQRPSYAAPTDMPPPPPRNQPNDDGFGGPPATPPPAPAASFSKIDSTGFAAPPATPPPAPATSFSKIDSTGFAAPPATPPNARPPSFSKADGMRPSSFSKGDGERKKLIAPKASGGPRKMTSDRAGPTNGPGAIMAAGRGGPRMIKKSSFSNRTPGSSPTASFSRTDYNASLPDE